MSHEGEAERRRELMAANMGFHEWLRQAHPSHTCTESSLGVPLLATVGRPVAAFGCVDCGALLNTSELKAPCPAAADRQRADDAAQLRRIADALERMNGLLEELLQATIAAAGVKVPT